MKLTISNHALDEAVKKFGRQHKLAEGWIRSNFSQAKYIGMVLDDEAAKECRLFSHQRICFILATETDHVITVYPRRHATPTLTSKINAIIEKEVRKAERKVRAVLNRNTLIKADVKVEIAELERRIVRTKSQSVKSACQARINALNEYLSEITTEEGNVKKEKSTLLKGVAMYV
jgi:DNA repair exonuclease SbcCD nuclease subunit